VKTRILGAVLVLLVTSAVVSADEVSDCLERALKLHKAGKLVEAKAEIEKALAAIAPMARALMPKPEVKGNTYINYEHAFRVTQPETDWRVRSIKGTGGGRATYPLCQLTYVRKGRAGDDIIIFYMRDLKEFLGGQYDEVKGNELAFAKLAGKQMASAVAQLTDVKVTTQTEITVSGLTGVRTDYTARKKGKNIPMKCFTLHVIRGHMMLTGMFVGSERNEADVTPAFESILKSIDLSPVTPTPK